MILEDWQHASQDFEPQIFFVAQSIRAPLDYANLVVQTLDESQRHFIFRFAVSGDPIPMTTNHLSEFLVRFQALPLEAVTPIFEEAPRPALTLVAPKLAETLLEQIGRIQALVRCKQGLQRAVTIQVQVRTRRQQGVLLPLDVAPLWAGEPSVLAFADLVERVSQMPHDVEHIEQQEH